MTTTTIAITRTVTTIPSPEEPRHNHDMPKPLPQITEPQLQTTQDCTNQYLLDACNTIQTELNISWSSAAWSDLRKPLYSGLAAALLTLLELAGADMPGSVADQADLWVRMYGGDANTFSSVAENATRLEGGWGVCVCWGDVWLSVVCGDFANVVREGDRAETDK